MIQKTLVENLNIDTCTELTPRLYQLEILEEAVQSNSLAFLGTGAGKTLIAVLFIKYRLALAKKLLSSPNLDADETFSTSPRPAAKKIIAFVAPTKILVEQQCRYIKSNCDCVIRSYTGESTYSEWTSQYWADEIGRVDCLVFTPEVFRHLVQMNLLPVTSLDSVIFDECHHCHGQSPM
jgi:endoribonuclease Dicer